MKFTPVIHHVKEIPVGKYIAYLDNGDPCYLEVVEISNGTLATINDRFHFDHANEVVAYAPFPALELDK